MIADFAVALLVLAVLAVVAELAVRRARAAGPVLSLSPRLRLWVHGAALGSPWLLSYEGSLPGTAAGDLLVPFALSIGLYAVALWLVGDGAGRCRRTSGSAS